MKNKIRKQRPQPPQWFAYDTDCCWCCKNRNRCGGCKFLKRYIYGTKQKARRNSKFK